jgi:hypothetical protein
MERMMSRVLVFVGIGSLLLSACGDAADGVDGDNGTTDTGALGSDTAGGGTDTGGGGTDTGGGGGTDTGGGGTDTGGGGGTDTGGGGGGKPTSPDCDLNGRWLVSQRVVATAIGQDQASHNWFYYEIKQDGDDVTVTKGLHCGYEVKKLSALAVNVNSEVAWPSLLKNCSSTGRKGKVVVSGDQCQIDFVKEYVVRGATVAAYLDPSKPMPTKDQAASGSTPGHEDWEPDTHPGITLTITGTASGKLYVAQRDWTQYSGKVAKNAVKWMVPITWNNEQVPLGRDGSSLLEQSSVPKSDASAHFVWFHKLSDGQAVGSDTEICAAVRTLKGTLVPEADK